MKTWQLRKGAEKRFLSGHPWVFSNELSVSPKGTDPGETIRLTDDRGQFLAVGYGNPRSLISFRALSYLDEEVDAEFFLRALQKASTLRRITGVYPTSHRLVFAENDYLPGLIADRYWVSNQAGKAAAQVLVIQSSTAGMDRCLPYLEEALPQLIAWEKNQGWSDLSWEETCLVYANSSNSRSLEGIPVEPKTVKKAISGVDATNITALIESGTTGNPLQMSFDILGGQKTGFFLDQRENIKRLMSLLLANPTPRTELRILDICSYVGQWSTQLAAYGQKLGLQTDCTLADASETALSWAQKNIERYGGRVSPIRTDVLQGLRGTIDQTYDVVICDPPALIKKKKDVPQGRTAYLKLNRDAVKKVKDGGYFVSCSCSGLLNPSEFREMLGRASFGSHLSVQWIQQGFHGPDHPQRLEYPEGSYLKCMIGRVTRR